MSSFSERLRAEIEFSGMLQKEVAFKAGIKKRALDMYIGKQESMPPADIAVKLAKVLNVTVEYLVTGENEARKIKEYEFLQRDLSILPSNIALNLCETIHLMAERERNLTKKTFPYTP